MLLLLVRCNVSDKVTALDVSIGGSKALRGSPSKGRTPLGPAMRADTDRSDAATHIHTARTWSLPPPLRRSQVQAMHDLTAERAIGAGGGPRANVGRRRQDCRHARRPARVDEAVWSQEKEGGRATARLRCLQVL